MTENKLIELLENYKRGECSLDEAIETLRLLPFKDIDYAKIDTHRIVRQGYAEAVYCPGKSVEQIINIMLELKKHTPVVLATRASTETAQSVMENLQNATYDPEARIIALGEFPEVNTTSCALVITAGTADIPVAKEAIITIKSNGVRVDHIFDIGVAGAHRIFKHIDLIQKASAIVVVAGMEGALASLVGGISPCPVIAVPTSKGYGANLQGLAPLLSMLNSCTSCVSIVNIDNGYSAGIIASLIVKQSWQT